MSRAGASARKKTAGDGTARVRLHSANPAADRTVRYGPLAGYVGYALRRAQMWSVAGFLEVMKEVDLRPTQFAVLMLIHQNPGIRQTEVCASLGLQKANFVTLLNELQRRRLAVRKTGVSDRRSSALHLTTEGEALLTRGLELHVGWEKLIEARLGSRGREQLLALLQKLT